MKLKNLLKNVEIKSQKNFNENLEVKNIFDDSRKVKPNSLFFAITGFNTSGEIYIEKAIENGASVVVLENDNYLKNFENNSVFSEKNIKNNEKNIKNYEKIKNTTFIFVKNIRKAVAIISSNFYNNACEKLKIISIVGTNGKTSTSHIISNILKVSGKKVGTIGTNGIYFNDKKIENDMTTPDPIFLHFVFNEMVKANIEYVVMEVSAHAIKLDKMFGVKSECAVFTNFSQDHLDFFKTMENYKNVKKSYFNSLNTKSCIINIDDEVGKELLKEVDIPTTTYGIKNPSDVFAINISMNLKGSEFVVNAFDEVFKVSSNLTCLFNVYNMLSAICCALNLGIEKEKIIDALKSLNEVKGRFNLIDYGQNFNVIIDYAHTPQSLENLLTNIKTLNKNRTISVFGCPGNRDELKRELMGEIAGKISDYVILTTDNPQFENSYRIMRDIERGVIKTNCPYKLIDDRSEAISFALSLATPKSNVVIVGKGVEDYQNINGKHIAYSDFDEVEKQLKFIKKINLETKFCEE